MKKTSSIHIYMKIKTFFLLLTIISAFFFYFPKQASAEALMNKSWMCLQTPVGADGKPLRCDQAGANCSGHEVKVHRAKLTVKDGQKSRPTSKVYIVACFGAESGGTGQICTTGNSSLDRQANIFGADNYSLVKTKLQRGDKNYKFEGLYYTANGGVSIHSETSAYSDPDYLTSYPVTANSSGDIQAVEWQDFVPPPGADHKFMAFNLIDPNEAVTGEGGGLVQATFPFEKAEKDCAVIHWDPYGRVFDKETLEPVNNAQVTLKVKEGDDFVFANILGVTNPQITREDGNFNFVVPNGTYKLEVQPYPIEASLAAVHPNYSKVYSDIYPVETGEEIVQRNSAQHRDIPITRTGSTTGPRTPLKLFDFFADISEGKIIVRGRASHPFSLVTIWSAKLFPNGTKQEYRPIASGEADKNGKFRILVDQADLEVKTEYREVVYNAKLKYVDIRVNSPAVQKPNPVWNSLIGFFSLWIKQVKAQEIEVSIPLDPIPTFLEGYAYDSVGKPIANATVGLYPKFSNSPSYQVKADENGYFKITSEYIPPMAYDIRYTSANGVITKTTTTAFLVQNQKTFQEKQTDPFIYKDAQNRTVSASSRPSGERANNLLNSTQKRGQNTSNSSMNAPVGTNKIGGSSSMQSTTGKVNIANIQGIIMIIIVIIMLVGIGIAAVFFMKPKQPPITY